MNVMIRIPSFFPIWICAIFLILPINSHTIGLDNMDTGITSIAAREKELILSLKVPPKTRIKILELKSYESLSEGKEFPSVWEGDLFGEKLSIPRFMNTRDLLFSKFVVISVESGDMIGSPHYVEDCSSLSPRDFDFVWNKDIKGISVIIDLDDAVSLGVRYAADNLVIGSLLDLKNPNPKETWEVDGIRIPINTDYIQQLDRKVKSLTDAGINLTFILLNAVPTAPDPDNPLINPITDLENAPFHLGAFNVEDEKGLIFYRGIIEYLANRYSRPDVQYGHISGFIIGNEVNAHYTWYNIGRMPLERFVEHYHRVLRITQLAANKFHSKLRVYASLEHHWNIRFSTPLESFRGKEFIDALNDLSKREGDFPWHIAFHPYPENLFDPRVWEDKTALLCYDTPKITFKNLEVLTAYLSRSPLLYRNEPRRVILSEQGFHWDGTPEGEKIQAAAFAYAFFKVSHIPGIDTFMYYRHVSSKHEFGLRLGMYAGDTEDPNEKGKGRMLFLHEVFRDAGTKNWEKAFEFAKPILGINSWDQILPESDSTTFTQSCMSIPADESSMMVLDLTEKLGEVTPTNCPTWRYEPFFDAVGYRPGIFHHPPEKGYSDAVFTLTLPSVESGKHLVMKFDTAFTHQSDDGVCFSILLDGKELWSHEQKKIEPESHKIDLTKWVGKNVSLTLRIDSLQNSMYDWSVWVWPRILIE